MGGGGGGGAVDEGGGRGGCDERLFFPLERLDGRVSSKGGGG